MRLRKMAGALAVVLTLTTTLAPTRVYATGSVTYSSNGYTFEKISHPNQGTQTPDGIVDYQGNGVVTAPSDSSSNQGDRGQSYSWAALGYGDWVYIGTCYAAMGNTLTLMDSILGDSFDKEVMEDTLKAMYNGTFFYGHEDGVDTDGILVKLNTKTGEVKLLMSKSLNGQAPLFRNAVEYNGKLYFCGSVRTGGRAGLPKVYEIDPETDTCTEIFNGLPSYAEYAQAYREGICTGIRGMCEYNGQLVISMVGLEGASIWVSSNPSDGQGSFTQIASQSDLFNYPAYHYSDSIYGGSVWDMVSYNGSLYVSLCTGTPDNTPDDNSMQSFAIVRGDSNGDGTFTWTSVVGEQGYGSTYTYGIDPARTRSGAANLYVYNGYLYIGEYNDEEIALERILFNKTGDNTDGSMGGVDCSFVNANLEQSVNLYRMDTSENMELVVGDATSMFPSGGISNLGSGFGHNENQYIWRMEEFDGKLYVGTFDTSSLLEPVGQFSNGDIIGMTEEEWNTQIVYIQELLETLFGKMETSSEEETETTVQTGSTADESESISEEEETTEAESASQEETTEAESASQEETTVESEVTVVPETESTEEETVLESESEAIIPTEEVIATESETPETVTPTVETEEVSETVLETEAVEEIPESVETLTEESLEVQSLEEVEIVPETLVDVYSKNGATVLDLFTDDTELSGEEIGEVAETRTEDEDGAWSAEAEEDFAALNEQLMDASVLVGDSSAIMAIDDESTVEERINYFKTFYEVYSSMRDAFLELDEKYDLPEELRNAYEKLLNSEALDRLDSVIECMNYLSVSTRGFDLYVTEDGVNFQTVTTDGFGDPYNHGLRVFAINNSGLSIGTANPFNGTQIWIQRKDMTPEVPESTEESGSTEETSEAEESSSAEETSEVEESSSAEETSEAEESSGAEETSEAVESSSAEETSEADESSSAEETSEAVESSSAEETSEAVESSSVEETSEAEESSGVEETSGAVESSGAEESSNGADVPESSKSGSEVLSSSEETSATKVLETTAKKDDTKKNNSAQTGDTMRTTLYGMLLLSGMAGIVFLFIKRKVK